MLKMSNKPPQIYNLIILDPPSNEVRAIVHTNEKNRRLTVHLHFLKVFPLPRCTALIGVR